MRRKKQKWGGGRWHKYGAKPQYVLDDRGPFEAASLSDAQKEHLIEQGAIYFQSKKEAERWLQLRFLEKIGQIKNLKRQVQYKINVPQVYKADFTYDDSEHGFTVEDSEGYRTAEYKRKIKALQKEYSWIRFIET